MRRATQLLFAAAVGCGVLTARAEMERVNGIAVVVNDAIITRQEVKQHIGLEVEVLQRQYLPARPETYQLKLDEAIRDGMEQLKDRQLILHEFKTAGYSLPESLIEDTIRDRIRRRFGDRATLAKSLKQQGVTLETFRQRTREEIIVDALRAKNVSKELLVSPQKIVDYYQANSTNFAEGDKIRIRMIVLNKTANGNNAETRALAGEIRERIEAGAPFEEMARIYSDGSQRAVGGDWGWYEVGKLEPVLAAAAATVQKGQRSGVLETTQYYCLMQVEDKRPAHVRPLSEARDSIEKDLLVKEKVRLEKRWITRLEKKSFVRYY